MSHRAVRSKPILIAVRAYLRKALKRLFQRIKSLRLAMRTFKFDPQNILQFDKCAGFRSQFLLPQVYKF